MSHWRSHDQGRVCTLNLTSNTKPRLRQKDRTSGYALSSRAFLSLFISETVQHIHTNTRLITTDFSTFLYKAAQSNVKTEIHHEADSCCSFKTEPPGSDGTGLTCECGADEHPDHAGPGPRRSIGLSSQDVLHAAASSCCYWTIRHRPQPDAALLLLGLMVPL